MPDGCITLTQFYLGVLVLVYFLCLFCIKNFDVLLTVHLTIFISVINQPVHQTATYRCDDTRGCVMQV